MSGKVRSSGRCLSNVLKVIVVTLKRIRLAVGSRGLMAMASGDLPPERRAECIPRNMLSLSQALALFWDKAVEELQGTATSDLNNILVKIELAEAAAATTTSRLLQDEEVFSSIRGHASAFHQQYNDLLTEAIPKCGASHTKAFQTYIEKYEPIENAAQAWNMTEVAWMYVDETEKEVNSDITTLVAAVNDSKSGISMMNRIVGCNNLSEQFTKNATLAKDQRDLIVEKCSRATRLCSIMLLVDLTHEGNEGTPKESQKGLATLLKYIKETFGVGTDETPLNLPEALADALKKLPAEAPKGSEKTKKRKPVEEEASGSGSKDVARAKQKTHHFDEEEKEDQKVKEKAEKSEKHKDKKNKD